MIRQIYLSLAFIVISLMTHAVWSMGFLSPLSIVKHQNRIISSPNADELPDMSLSLPTSYQKEIQNNELLKYFQILDNYQKELKMHSNSSRKLLQIHHQLKEIKINLNQCEQKAEKAIKIYQYEMNLLKKSSSIHYLQMMNQNKKYLYQQNRNNLMICRYLNYKIARIMLQIQEYQETIYLNSFSKKYNNVLMAFKNCSYVNMKSMTFGFAIDQVLYHSRLFSNIFILLITFFVLYVWKMFYSKYELTSLSSLDLSLKRYFHVVLIFCFISPVLFLILKITYAHHDEILIKIIKQQGSILVFFVTFLYLYIFYNRKHFNLDLWVAVPSFFFQLCLIYLTMRTYYDDLYYISESDSLVIKYFLLFNLQFVMLYEFYWLVLRALEIPKIKWCFIGYSVFLLFIFAMGLYGYVDMAINLDFIMVLTLILLTWVVLLTRFRKIIINKLQAPSKIFQKKLQELLNDDYHRAMFNIEILVNYIYFVLFIQFIIITLISNLWFYSIDVVFSWYELLYHEHHIGNYSFVLIRHFHALASFLFLNIVNYFSSNYFANQLLDNKISIAKTAQLFYWLGMIVILMICCVIAGFDLQNLLLIFGGLLLGVGFAMKNILFDLFAGILIYINRPFEIGDLINIAQQKGYVYKIGLLETVIKNLDKDIIIFPNQFVASSIIENYTFKNKTAHAIHLIYRVDNLKEHNEALIKEIVLKIVQKEKQVVKNKNEYVQCIISPDMTTAGTYQIELIIFLNNLRTLKTKSNDLNLKILAAFKLHHLQVQFISVNHALNDQSS